jgi:osmotically-inducible protein OsmY
MNAVRKESISDSELQRDVLDELKWDPGVNAAHIGVSAKNGVVTARGCSNGPEEPQQALDGPRSLLHPLP